jgi:hypothetical protein
MPHNNIVITIHINITCCHAPGGTRYGVAAFVIDDFKGNKNKKQKYKYDLFHIVGFLCRCKGIENN